jgi:O-antigen/teichoic acid export membrane protein
MTALIAGPRLRPFPQPFKRDRLRHRADDRAAECRWAVAERYQRRPIDRQNVAFSNNRRTDHTFGDLSLRELIIKQDHLPSRSRMQVCSTAYRTGSVSFEARPDHAWQSAGKIVLGNQQGKTWKRYRRMPNQTRAVYGKIARIFSWLVYSHQASLAIADQAIVSIGNFVLTVVIVRMAGVDTLGGFAIITVLSTFGATVSSSLIDSPAMVLFAFMEKQEEYYRGFVIASSVAMGVALSIGLSLIYAIYRLLVGDVSSYCELFAIAALFFLMPISQTVRRIAFARGKGWAGLRVSLLRSIPPPAILYFANPWVHSIQLFHILIIVASANALAVLNDLLIDRPPLPNWNFATVNAQRHWISSRWLLLSSILNSGYTDIFTIGTGFIFGDLAVAAIRISQQIFGIMVAGLQTFENTLPRQLALLARDSDREPFLSFVDWITGITFFGLALCGGLVWWFGNDLIWLIFGIDYGNNSLLLLFWAASTACIGARSVFTFAYRAMEHTRPIFAADACSFLVAITIVLPILHLLGVVGSAVGMLIANLTGLAVLLGSMPRHSRNRI